MHAATDAGTSQPVPQDSPAIGDLSPALLTAISLIFILSGATALVYEVVWTRQLTTFFGSTLYGVATVLTAFMGGLALGSYLAGRVADRLRKPLAAYGWFEIGIAFSALAFPVLLDASQPLIGTLYVTGGESTFYLFSLVRFVIVFFLLLVPTTLMGATLPVMSKAVTRTISHLGHRVGMLYALNTAGAVLGVFAAGFILLEALGVFGTTMVAVIGDIAIGVFCVVAGQRLVVRPAQPRLPAEPAPGAPAATLSPAVLRLVLLTYLVSGFVALAYQVAWTRALIFSFDTLKSTTYSFSGMLLVFLLGLAVGSAIMQAVVDRQRDLLRLYALLQAGIGLSGALSFFVILSDLPTLREIADDQSLIYWNAVGNVMIKTAAAIGLPTLLMGMAFPVVTRLVVGSVDKLGMDVSRVYALNTVGAILGSFLAGFVLIPAIGLTSTIALLAAVNLALAALLFQSNAELEPRLRLVYTAAVVVGAVLVLGRIFFASVPLQRLQPNETIVHYEEGAMATISVVENHFGDRMIYVDDVGVAGTDKVMLTDQKSLAHVPMMLLGGRAENVLSVGFGSGGASYSYTLYDDIERIRTIEIAPEVLRAAPTLTDSSFGIITPDSLVERAKAAGAGRISGFRHPLEDYVHTPAPGFKTFDPRFQVLIDDARAYLRFTDKRYDVIATDCTDLRYKSNANLYDLEYFTLCREAITDRGLVVVWMPLAGLSDRAFRSALRTFQEVFPEMTVWYFTNQPTHYCLLIGGKGPLRIDYDAVARAVTLPGIAEDLQEIGLADPDKLLSSFVCDERTLPGHLAGAPLNTEDHPIIEFESPRYGYDPSPLRDNQWALYEIQVPIEPLLVDAPPGAAERIWQLQQANFVVFQGHCLYRDFDYRGATRKYMEALAMVPWDDSIRGLMDFEELYRHFDSSMERGPTLNTLVSGQGLAEAYFLQERHTEAATVASRAVRLVEPILRDAPEGSDMRRLTLAAGFSLNGILARSYAANGTARRAGEYLERARSYAPSEQEWKALSEEVQRMLDAPAGG